MFSFRLGRQTPEEREEERRWWRGMPRWLKAIYVLIVIPAWLVMGYCVITGQSKSNLAIGAFAVFFAAGVVMVIFDRRKFKSDDHYWSVD